MSNDSFYADAVEGFKEEPENIYRRATFSPWHKPRKQYVRSYQWVRILKNNLRDIKPIKGPLKYFGLPGDDFFDIKLFHDRVCQPNDISLRYLTFNDFDKDESRKVHANLTITEVRAMTHIDSNSEEVQLDILNAGTTGTTANKKAKRHGDFDIINLDFCDSVVFDDPAKNGDNHYKLLTQLLQLQSVRERPWLLYITTRFGREHIHDETLNAFLMCFSDNMKDHNFKNEAIETLKLEDNTLVNDLQDDKKFFNITLISLCKWLLKASLQNYVSLKIEDVIEYRVTQNDLCDMVSLALKFTPKPKAIIDPLKLAKHTHPILKEEEIAQRFINKVAQRIDCDEKLKSDKDIYERVFKESCELLNSAHYDLEEYEKWCDNNQ